MGKKLLKILIWSISISVGLEIPNEVITIVFGRFFCGFACAFGTLGDFVHEFYVWICKKVKRKSVGISDSINEKSNPPAMLGRIV